MKILIPILAYFIGNISTAFIVGKFFGKIDIRNYGSGNAGTTNVLRTIGKKAAAMTFVGDVLKGVIAVILGKILLGIDGEVLAGIFVVIGHNWPLLLGFKGGKGIATSIGVMLMIKPILVLIPAAVALIFLFKSRYVSLASVIGMVALPVAAIITLQPFKIIVLCLCLTIMALIRHSKNIERLLNGTESKIGQKSRVK